MENAKRYIINVFKITLGVFVTALFLTFFIKNLIDFILDIQVTLTPKFKNVLTLVTSLYGALTIFIVTTKNLIK